MRDFPTYEDGDDYIHYTCQSIDDKKLAKNKIAKIGEQFGIEAREVLSVPKKTLEKKGYKPKSDADAQALIESMLRRLAIVPVLFFLLSCEQPRSYMDDIQAIQKNEDVSHLLLDESPIDGLGYNIVGDSQPFIITRKSEQNKTIPGMRISQVQTDNGVKDIVWLGINDICRENDMETIAQELINNVGVEDFICLIPEQQNRIGNYKIKVFNKYLKTNFPNTIDLSQCCNTRRDGGHLTPSGGIYARRIITASIQ